MNGLYERRQSCDLINMQYDYVCAVSEVPGSTATTNKEELVSYLKLMYTMRRMEITNDTEYKVWQNRIECKKLSHGIIHLRTLHANNRQ